MTARGQTEPKPSSDVPGLPCPACGSRLVTSMETLLSLQPIVCASCGLRLEVDQEGSAQTLRDLRELQRRVALARGS